MSHDDQLSCCRRVRARHAAAADGRCRRSRHDLAGIANGSLTEREVARIERHDQRLDNASDRALSDGDLSRGEFRGLNQAYNRESRVIYRQKHDRQNQ